MSNARSEILTIKMTRFKKACEFMDGPADIEAKERWEPELWKVLDEINVLAAGYTEAEINKLLDGEEWARS